MGSAVSPRVRFPNSREQHFLGKPSVISSRKLSFPSSNRCMCIFHVVGYFHICLPFWGKVTEYLEHRPWSNPAWLQILGLPLLTLRLWTALSRAQWGQQRLSRGVVCTHPEILMLQNPQYNELLWWWWLRERALEPDLPGWVCRSAPLFLYLSLAFLRWKTGTTTPSVSVGCC